MAAAVIHRCQNCGFEMDIGAPLEVFEQDPHCGRCGLSATEGNLKMQEELATLVTQRLNLQGTVNYETQPESLPTPPQRDSEAPIAYITQHYHHSAHQAVQTPPGGMTSLTDMLASHGIDARTLFPSQINLFEQAQPEQQVRLIQLWSIAPPSSAHQLLTSRNDTHWPQTSMQQEEEAAQARYLKRQAELELDSSPELKNNAEPYIVRGYEAASEMGGKVSTDPNLTARRPPDYNRALDPAYQSEEWWLHESQPIEHQFGIAQQIRQSTDQDHDMS